MRALRNVVLALAILFVLTAVTMAAGGAPADYCWLYSVDTELPSGCDFFTDNLRWREKPRGDATLTCRFDDLELYADGACVPDQTIRSEDIFSCVYGDYTTTDAKWVVSKNGKARLTCRFHRPPP